MPPTSPPMTAAPFHIASVTVRPKPSRVDFCRMTAADRGRNSSTGTGQNVTQGQTNAPAQSQTTAPGQTQGQTNQTSQTNAPAQGQTSPTNQTNAPAQGQTTAAGQTQTSTNLTAQQQTTLQQSVLRASNAPRVNVNSINFQVHAGVAVPSNISVVSVSTFPALIDTFPAFRDHSFFVVDDEVVFVDRDRRVVDVV